MTEERPVWGRSGHLKLKCGFVDNGRPFSGFCPQRYEHDLNAQAMRQYMPHMRQNGSYFKSFFFLNWRYATPQTASRGVEIFFLGPLLMAVNEAEEGIMCWQEHNALVKNEGPRLLCMATKQIFHYHWRKRHPSEISAPNSELNSKAKQWKQTSWKKS